MARIWDLLKRLTQPGPSTSIKASRSGVAVNGPNNGMIIVNDTEEIEAVVTKVIAKQTAIINQGVPGELETEIDRQVNEYRDKMNAGMVNAALDLFVKLLEHQAKNLSPTLIFRIKANIAICKHQLGEAEQAVRLLFEACTYAPEDPRAIAYKALAYIFDGKLDQALTFGLEKLDENPSNELLAGFMLQATRIKYQNSDSFVDPFPGFSEGVKQSKSVRLAHIHLLASHEASNWRELASTLLEEYPDDPQAKNLVATGILHHYIKERQSPNGFKFSKEDIYQIKLAAEYFYVEWSVFKESDRAANSGDLQTVQSLLILYKLSNNIEALRLECEYVLANLTHDQDLIETTVKCLLDLNQNELCDAAIKKVTSAENAREFKFLSMVARKDWDGLNKFQDYSFSKFSGVFLLHAKIVVYISRAYKGNAQGKIELERLLAEEELDSRARLLLFEFAVESRIQSIALLAHSYGYSRVGSDTDVIELHHYMKLVRFLLDWKEVITRLSPLPEVHENYELKHMLALAYVNEHPIRVEGASFFEALKQEPRGFELLLGIFYFKRKDYSSAASFIEQYYSSGGRDLYGFLLLCEMAKLNGDSAGLADAFSIYDPEELEGTPEQFMQVAKYLASAGKSEEALTLAYDTYEANKNQPKVALGYFHVFLLANKDVLSEESAPVGPGCYFKLVSSDGVSIERMVGGSVEDDLALAPKSVDPYIRKVLGASVGYEYTQSKLQGEVTWKLEEVKHRFVQAFHQVCTTYESRFPDEGGLWSLKVEEGDIQPLLDIVKDKAERDEEFLATILEKNIPLEIAAGMWSKNIFQVVDLMRSTTGHIQTCAGTAEERDLAIESVKRFKGKPVVLDSYTAWVTAELGLVDALSEYFSEVVISQGTILTMQVMMNEFEGLSGSGISVGWKNGVFTRSEFTVEDTNAQRDRIAANIRLLEEKCTVAHYDFSSSLDELTEQLVKIRAEAVVPYFLAKEREAIFISEDAYSRGFAGNIYKLVDSAWLQPIINLLVQEGYISGDFYAKSILGLCRCRHNFVSISSFVLENIYDKDTKSGMYDFLEISEYIGGQNADVESHYQLISGFILRHWVFDYNPTFDQALEKMLRKSHGDAFPTAKALKATSIMFERLIKLPGGVHLLNDLIDMPVLRLRDFAIKWWKGHFYQA
ncbi:hypothetical protein M1M11_08170 [Pseudomonas azerbaijanoccidens]|uniref:tetratricopeptide repeat protein n=1 Tax=Pseudomonas azerbaijanoccidentalis TaxID=2842347 RepID=UPI00200B2C1F|nr:hypothetical protein [Pseudomonas azerbaijanoccidentalis]MCK8664858.1 hypothetical protein [Pseudomonas azerbaijanoccidentalis]